MPPKIVFYSPILTGINNVGSSMLLRYLCHFHFYSKSWSRNGTVGHSQSKEVSILWSYHELKKQGSCLEKEIMQGTMPGARRRGRPHTAWMDNIKTWTGLSMEESIRMTAEMEKVCPWCGQP